MELGQKDSTHDPDGSSVDGVSLGIERLWRPRITEDDGEEEGRKAREHVPRAELVVRERERC